ncbi:MAG: PAS domain S-box protein [Asgard group archaeon]|nr:PAS domain S-box protein [Asgard group archaeon]
MTKPNQGDPLQKQESKTLVTSKLQKYLQDDTWFKNMIESMGEGVIASNLNKTILYVNEAICEMLGYSKAEIIGKNSLDFVIENDRQKVINKTEERYQSKKASQYEVSLKTKLGSKVPVLVNGSPILSPEGETIGSFALITNISDRKLVEKELRDKNAELTSLYNNLLELYEQVASIIAETTKFHAEIYLFTSKTCVYCDPAERVLQEVLSSYGGKITYRKVDVEEEPELAQQYDILSLPTIAIGDTTITSIPDAHKLHSTLFSALVPEEKFRRTRQELDNIVNNSPIAIFTINKKGIITGGNPIFETMSGLKRKELVGKNIFSDFEEKDTDINHPRILKILKEGLTGEKISINRLPLKEISDNKELANFSILSFKIVPMKNKEGEVTEILVLAEDVTRMAMQERELEESNIRLEELNEQLVRMNKERANFVEVTTSGLFEPLQKSKELLEGLLSGEMGKFSDELFGTIEYLLSNVKSVSKSINDILDFSSMEAQGFRLNCQEHNVNNLISEAMQDIGSVVIDKGFIATKSIPEDMKVWCDSEQINRVLKNLMLNAIKFTPENCKINFTAKDLENGFVEIAIADNGIGLKEEDLERIFEQYVKVDPESEGSGLGLTVVKSIIEEHGGSVRAFSEGLGKGSTFYFTLPKNKNICLENMPR